MPPVRTAADRLPAHGDVAAMAENRARACLASRISAWFPFIALARPAMSITQQVKRRRTFAIISRPDAGKTTLTEKLSLFAGAIQIAGSVKARKAQRHASSDWMEIEKQRGISVASSVMQMRSEEHT